MDLEKEIEKREKEAESLSDDGHLALVKSLKTLLARAEEGTYHDFHKNGAAAPKSQLVEDLQSIIINVKSGSFDN